MRMRLRNPEIDVYVMILEWGLSFSEHRNKGSSPIEDEPFRR